MFSRTLKKPGTIATITGDLNTLDHAEKLKGFAAALATMAPHLSLRPAIESHDRPKDAARATLALLSHRPRPAGIYISTANSLPVIRALEERNALEQIQVITTDLFPELVSFLESGSGAIAQLRRSRFPARFSSHRSAAISYKAGRTPVSWVITEVLAELR